MVARYAKKFDWASELGVREDPRVHVSLKEGPMKVMNSCRFLDDTTEMACVVTEPNEESMEYAQASGSLRRGRAGEEEHDVCSSCLGVNSLKGGSWTLGTRSLSVADSEFFAVIEEGSVLLRAKSFGQDVGQCVMGTASSSAKSISTKA